MPLLSSKRNISLLLLFYLLFIIFIYYEFHIISNKKDLTCWWKYLGWKRIKENSFKIVSIPKAFILSEFGIRWPMLCVPIICTLLGGSHVEKEYHIHLGSTCNCVSCISHKAPLLCMCAASSWWWIRIALGIDFIENSYSCGCCKNVARIHEWV